MSFRLCLVALLLMAASCARIQPPPGGPIDKIPPELTGSCPADGSLDNGVLDTITLSFSERVDRASVLKHLRSDPPWLLRSEHWQADTLLVLRYWEPFPADTTMAVFLLSGLRR